MGQVSGVKKSIGGQMARWFRGATRHVFEGTRGMGTQMTFCIENAAFCEGHAPGAVFQ
jgi:hypothetical protein